MMNYNKVVYLVPHYNDPDGLNVTLSSITENVKVIVVDDGSERKPEINFEIISLDVEVIYLSENKGIVEALNHGLYEAKKQGYSYVARVDAGDKVIGKRISKQLSYMQKNNLSLCGTYVNFVDENFNFQFRFTPPVEHEQILKKIKIFNPFIHPSTMYLIDDAIECGGYTDFYPALEDWSLFMKLSENYRIGILNEFCLDYVLSPKSISTSKRKIQARSKIRLLIDNFEINFHSILGLMRNIIVYFVSRETLSSIKKVVYK